MDVVWERGNVWNLGGGVELPIRSQGKEIDGKRNASRQLVIYDFHEPVGGTAGFSTFISCPWLKLRNCPWAFHGICSKLGIRFSYRTMRTGLKKAQVMLSSTAHHGTHLYGVGHE